MTSPPAAAPARRRAAYSHRGTPGALLGYAMTLGAAILLGACGSDPTNRYYAIESGTPARAPAAYSGPPVQVLEVKIPASMNRPELVREFASGEVQLREFDRWAAPLERSVRQALTESLAVRLPEGKVVFAGATRPAERLDLNVEVLSLRIANGSASMWVAWGVQQLGPGAPAPCATREVRLQTAAGDDAAATAKAWSALLGQLADRVAAELPPSP
jgi:uncharacterized protein